MYNAKSVYKNEITPVIQPCKSLIAYAVDFNRCSLQPLPVTMEMSYPGNEAEMKVLNYLLSNSSEALINRNECFWEQDIAFENPQGA